MRKQHALGEAGRATGIENRAGVGRRALRKDDAIACFEEFGECAVRGRGIANDEHLDLRLYCSGEPYELHQAFVFRDQQDDPGIADCVS